MRARALTAGILWLAASSAVAQELPEGHPPVEQQLPEGHPPVGQPPPEQQQLPPDHPPLGPADVVRNQNAGRDQRTIDSAHGGMDRAALRRVLGEGEPIAVAQPSSELPAGTIRVAVVDAAGQPVSGATVLLGVMQQSGDRDRRPGRTNAEGVFSWTGLQTGGEKSYRVNVVHEGATYSTTPFQLPPDRGYDARIRRLPTTEDERVVLQFLGQVMLELRDDRLHVIQQAQLINMAEETYVFPDRGLQVRLPSGFTAWQSQPVMTDQRLVATERGFAIEGSLPPGRVTLTWAFDLPLDGTEVRVDLEQPWQTYMYRVIAEAAPGMRLDIDGFPEPELIDNNGQKVLVTQVERTPGDPPIERVELRLRGIPGPGPIRWIALGGAIVLGLMGVMLATRGGRLDASSASSRARRKKELLDEAAELERMFAAGEIGPKYRAGRMEALTRELALVLRQEASATKPSARRA